LVPGSYYGSSLCWPCALMHHKCVCSPEQIEISHEDTGRWEGESVESEGERTAFVTALYLIY
jgi:hypothetical protein